jgi:hypothetical protein
MPPPERSTDKTSNRPDIPTIVTGIVAVAYTITYSTVDQLKKLLGTTLGVIILLTVIYLTIYRFCTFHIKQNAGTYYGRKNLAKPYRIARGITTVLFLIAIPLVYWRCELLLHFLPKSETGIIVNTIDGDNSELKIKSGIIDNVEKNLDDAEGIQIESAELHLKGGSGDKEQIIQHFACERNCRGIFAYGTYRPADQILSGKVYIHNLPMDSLNKEFIVFPNLNVATVTVSKKVALFGEFISALYYQRNKQFDQSNHLIDKIWKDSNLLHADFKYHCFVTKGINFSHQGRNDLAQNEFSKANELKGNGEISCRAVNTPDGYVFYNNGIPDTIRESPEESFNYIGKYSTTTFDSSFVHNGYYVFANKGMVRDKVHYHIKKCSSDFSHATTLSNGKIIPYLDSIIALNK